MGPSSYADTPMTMDTPICITATTPPQKRHGTGLSLLC